MAPTSGLIDFSSNYAFERQEIEGNVNSGDRPRRLAANIADPRGARTRKHNSQENGGDDETRTRDLCRDSEAGNCNL